MLCFVAICWRFDVLVWEWFPLPSYARQESYKMEQTREPTLTRKERRPSKRLRNESKRVNSPESASWDRRSEGRATFPLRPRYFSSRPSPLLRSALLHSAATSPPTAASSSAPLPSSPALPRPTPAQQESGPLAPCQLHVSSSRATADPALLFSATQDRRGVRCYASLLRSVSASTRARASSSSSSTYSASSRGSLPIYTANATVSQLQQCPAGSLSVPRPRPVLRLSRRVRTWSSRLPRRLSQQRSFRCGPPRLLQRAERRRSRPAAAVPPTAPAVKRRSPPARRTRLLPHNPRPLLVLLGLDPRDASQLLLQRLLSPFSRQPRT